jgi:hypothetical protein
LNQKQLNLDRTIWPNAFLAFFGSAGGWGGFTNVFVRFLKKMFLSDFFTNVFVRFFYKCFCPIFLQMFLSDFFTNVFVRFFSRQKRTITCTGFSHGDDLFVRTESLGEVLFLTPN